MGRKKVPPQALFRPVPGLADAATCFPRLAPWAILFRPPGSARRRAKRPGDSSTDECQTGKQVEAGHPLIR